MSMAMNTISGRIKLICVNPEGYEGFLTKGKIYEGTELNIVSAEVPIGYYVYVNNDKGGNKDKYLKLKDELELDRIPYWCTFIKLENWRQRQLNLIGIQDETLG